MKSSLATIAVLAGAASAYDWCEETYGKQNQGMCTAAFCSKNLDIPHCQQFNCEHDEAKCTYDICQSRNGKYWLKYCNSYCDSNPSATQCISPTEVTACKTNATDCSPTLCASDPLKDSKFCNADYCKANPKDFQCLSVAGTNKCDANQADCTAAMCDNAKYFNSNSGLDSQGYENGKGTCAAFQCAADVNKCTPQICKRESAYNTKYCNNDYCGAHPSEYQCLGRGSRSSCKANEDRCDAIICANSEAKDYPTCISFFNKEAIKKADAEKKAKAEAEATAKATAAAKIATAKAAAATLLKTEVADEGKTTAEAKLQLGNLQKEQTTASQAVKAIKLSMTTDKCATTGKDSADCKALAVKLIAAEEIETAAKAAVVTQNAHYSKLKKDAENTTTTIIIIAVVATVVILGGVGWYCHSKKKAAGEEVVGATEFSSDHYTAMIDAEE